LDPTDDGVRFRWFATVLLGAIAVGGAIDLALDGGTTLWSFHVVFEVALLLVSLGGVAYLWLGWRDASRTADETRFELEARSAERDAWRGRAEKTLRGLGEEIDRQLKEWSLTPVERETALLLLKGFGHKEIASLQAKSERTVRQHAVAVYRKSGLSGRAALSAFFLEDLLLPAPEAPTQAEAAEELPDRLRS
jgi:DNA-binding CsgD family transcriptional regulator